MPNVKYAEQDRVFSLDEFKQFDRLNQNTNSRIPIFFCIDISGSMRNKVGFFETRLSLLSKVMRKLLENMKKHPELSERAVIGVVTYNNRAILHQSALDLGIVDISKATSFDATDQTIFSLGLRRTLQEKHTGRKPIPKDWTRFGKLYGEWRAKNITWRNFMRRMDMSANTFYRCVREYEIHNVIAESTSA